MTRASPLVVAMVVLVAAVGPASAAFVGGTPAGDFVEYEVDGTMQPSFVVHYDNGSLDSLQSWVNESQTRELISTDEAHNLSVVAAPRWEAEALGLLDRLRAGGVTAALADDPLTDASWTQAVYPNWQIELDRPDPLDSDDFSPPTIGLTSVNDPPYPTDGVAFSDDASEETLAVARNATGADNVTAQGGSELVAVVDTGASTADGRIFGNGTAGSSIRIDNASKSLISNASVNASAGNFSAIADGNGHGTWVASAISANHSDDTFDGVVPNASLLVLRALDDEGSGSTADIAEAIRFAADQNADILSLSLGSPLWSGELQDAVDYAREQGTVVVVAAGNSRVERGANIASPADATGVVTVGATTANEPMNASSAYFSQVGPDPGTQDASEGASEGAAVDVAAPGFKLTAKIADEDGDVENSTLSGTSMATPLVSGTVAAALDDNSTLASMDEADIRDRLKASAVVVPNASVEEVGHGMAAAGNLANGTEPVTQQSVAQDSAADQRTIWYRSLSDASGGFVTQLIT